MTWLTSAFHPLRNFNLSRSFLHCAFSKGASIGSAVRIGCDKYSFGKIQTFCFSLNKQSTHNSFFSFENPTGSDIFNLTVPKEDNPVRCFAI